MRITEVQVIMLSAPVPEEHQYRSDFGTRVKTDAAVIKVSTDEGVDGYGVALSPPPVVKAMVENELAPMVVGQDPLCSDLIWERMYAGSRARTSLFKGYSFGHKVRRGDRLAAISGIDIAVWDCRARLLNVPLYRLLGGARDRVRTYASGGWGEASQIGPELAGYVAKGFNAVKMRAEGRGSDFSIATCSERVAHAREAIGPDIDLMVDGHGITDVATAVQLLRELEQYRLAWFEEPIVADNPEGLAEVRRRTHVPVASGERAVTRFEFDQLIGMKAVDVVQPDLGVCGGITEARRIAAIAGARGVRVAPHAFSSGILLAASLHFALATPECEYLEVAQANFPLLTEVFEESFVIRGEWAAPPEGPGLGLNIRSDVEERFPYIPGPEYVMR